MNAPLTVPEPEPQAASDLLGEAAKIWQVGSALGSQLHMEQFLQLTGQGNVIQADRNALENAMRYGKFFVVERDGQFEVIAYVHQLDSRDHVFRGIYFGRGEVRRIILKIYLDAGQKQAESEIAVRIAEAQARGHLRHVVQPLLSPSVANWICVQEVRQDNHKGPQMKSPGQVDLGTSLKSLIDGAQALIELHAAGICHGDFHHSHMYHGTDHAVLTGMRDMIDLNFDAGTQSAQANTLLLTQTAGKLGFVRGNAIYEKRADRYGSLQRHFQSAANNENSCTITAERLKRLDMQAWALDLSLYLGLEPQVWLASQYDLDHVLSRLQSLSVGSRWGVNVLRELGQLLADFCALRIDSASFASTVEKLQQLLRVKK